jgi:hypothetical protein
MVSSSMIDTGSTYEYNAAVKGGTFYCDTCTMVITSPVITNSQANSGGTFYMLDHIGAFTLTSTSFTDSKAYNKGGSFYIKGSVASQMTLTTI